MVRRTVLGDDRGFLSRLFCAQELREAGWDFPVAQINHTSTAGVGTVRGMHYQNPPHQEAKLVSCIRGAVWDVALDLRRGSSTFLQWTAHELSAENRAALLIPPGCAHGFQTLSPNAELLYLHSTAYEPAAEGGVNPLDPRVAIAWPKPVGLISQRDQSHPMLESSFAGVDL